MHRPTPVYTGLHRLHRGYTGLPVCRSPVLHRSTPVSAPVYTGLHRAYTGVTPGYTDYTGVCRVTPVTPRLHGYTRVTPGLHRPAPGYTRVTPVTTESHRFYTGYTAYTGLHRVRNTPVYTVGQYTGYTGHTSYYRLMSVTPGCTGLQRDLHRPTLVTAWKAASKVKGRVYQVPPLGNRCRRPSVRLTLGSTVTSVPGSAPLGVNLHELPSELPVYRPPCRKV